MTFVPLSATEIYVLGSDLNLWLEHADLSTGKFGQVLPPREQVDGSVVGFEPLSEIEVVVRGFDRNLWLEHADDASRMWI
jgi:hypothetical protein